MGVFMPQINFTHLLLRAQDLRGQLAQDHNGEMLQQLLDYFSDAEIAAKDILADEADAPTIATLTTISSVFVNCQSTLKTVWAELHPDVQPPQ